MRTSKFLLSAAAVAAAMSLFSCVRVEDSTTEVRVEQVTFGASFYVDDENQKDQNKTVLGENGLSVLWESNDQIAVSGGTGPFVIEPAIAEPTASVSFRGEAEVADVYYGVYPFSALKGWNGSTASMNLMQIQPARMGSFASDLNISVSSTDAATKTFQFHNVLGYLKFTIGEGSGKITELVVSTIGGEKLSGKFTVDCTSDKPVLVADSYANTSAAISSEQPLAPGDYYLALFPGTYADGLKFIVKGPNGVATKALNQKLTLQRGKVNTLGTINVTNWIKSVEKSTELSTMSFNIRSYALDNEDEGEHTLWANRKEPIAAMLMDLKPDILGLQEVMKDPQLDDLNSKLSGEYAYYVHTHESLLEIIDKSMFNVIMYRKSLFDLEGSGYQYFTQSGDYGTVPGTEAWGYCTDNSRRFFQWVKLTHKLSGKTVWVFNTHFPVNNNSVNDNNPNGDNSKAREVCMTKMVEKAYDLCGDDAIVYFTGDFNSAYSRADAFVLYVATSWLYDARTETEDRDNWNSGNSWKNLTLNGAASVDHIFYRNVTPVQYRTIVSDKYGVEFLSDHFAINFKSTMKWEVPVGPVFDAGFAEGFDIVKLEADLGEGFKDEDDYGDGNMEGFGPEDSFEFN